MTELHDIINLVTKGCVLFTNKEQLITEGGKKLKENRGSHMKQRKNVTLFYYWIPAPLTVN